MSCIQVEIFNEIKEGVGMTLVKKKENKKMHTPRQRVIPHPYIFV